MGQGCSNTCLTEDAARKVSDVDAFADSEPNTPYRTTNNLCQVSALGEMNFNSTSDSPVMPCEYAPELPRVSAWRKRSSSKSSAPSLAVMAIAQELQSIDFYTGDDDFGYIQGPWQSYASGRSTLWYSSEPVPVHLGDDCSDVDSLSDSADGPFEVAEPYTPVSAAILATPRICHLPHDRSASAVARTPRSGLSDLEVSGSDCDAGDDKSIAESMSVSASQWCSGDPAAGFDIAFRSKAHSEVTETTCASARVSSQAVSEVDEVCMTHRSLCTPRTRCTSKCSASTPGEQDATPNAVLDSQTFQITGEPCVSVADLVQRDDPSVASEPCAELKSNNIALQTAESEEHSAAPAEDNAEDNVEDSLSVAPHIGDVVMLGERVPSEFRGCPAVVTKVAESHCTVAVLDNNRQFGIGECWPGFADIHLDSKLLRLGTRVIVTDMQGARTRHLNGCSGVVSQHPRQEHPQFIVKPSRPDVPQLTVCVMFDDVRAARQRSALLEPRFLRTYEEFEEKVVRRTMKSLARMASTPELLDTCESQLEEMVLSLTRHASLPNFSHEDLGLLAGA